MQATTAYPHCLHPFPPPAPQLATYLAFGAEVYAWFCIGEIIGRGGSLTGYSI